MASMPDGIRIDKWLWAARCFKTRSMATAACGKGHVAVNGASAKPAKVVRPGDRLEVRTERGVRLLAVVAVSDRRGPAAVAQTLYIDHTPPPAPDDPAAGFPVREAGAGRPTKRERRQIRRLRGY